MTFYTLKAAPAASAVELKNNHKSTKAKRILVGCDVHLRGYQGARKVDEGAIGVVDNFRSEEAQALLLYIEKQRQQAEQVVVVYEAGPLGYTLYRKLRATGVLCYVCAPDSTPQRKKRRKNNQIDARSLTSKLFNYLHGINTPYNWRGCPARHKNNSLWPAGNMISWSKSASGC